MESLRVFTLVGCSKLEKFPNIKGKMSILLQLRLDGTSISGLSPSICNLIGLRVLSLKNCENLKSIPNSISDLASLKELHLSGCIQLTWLRIGGMPMHQVVPRLNRWNPLEKLDLCGCNLSTETIPVDIDRLSSLRFLDLSKNNFVSLPSSICRLSRLEILVLEDCRMLKWLPKVPSEVQKLNLNGCTSLIQIPDPTGLDSSEDSLFECLNCWELYKHNGEGNLGLVMLQRYMQSPSYLRSGFGIAVPGSKIPGWLSYHSKGSSISVQVPAKSYDDDYGLKGLVVCVAFKAYDESLSLSCHFKASGREYYPLPMSICYNSTEILSNHHWFFYLSFVHLKELQGWKHESFSNTNLSFHFCVKGVEVQNCGACLVYCPSISASSKSSPGHLIVATKGKESAVSSIASYSFSSYFCDWFHNVFISFRAEDASYNFIPYLFTALVLSFKTYEVRREFEAIREGRREFEAIGEGSVKAIDPRLMKAIEESRLSIIILTKHYDDVTSSVEKLLHIIQYVNSNMTDDVFPVSQNILDEQNGSFTIVFDKDPDGFREKREKLVERWMNILKKSSVVLKIRVHPWDLYDAHERVQLGPIVERNFVGQVIEENKHLICSWLTNDEVANIGIYGGAGMGKTALATHIHNVLLERQDIFGGVCWIAVTGGGHISRLQTLIAKEIGLHLSSEDFEEKRAAELYEALISKQKFVLILDNLRFLFVPKRVGIPVGVNGCKLVFTTPLLHVWQNMSCHKKIEVEPLSEVEAWTLFMEKLGRGKSFPPKIEQIAKSVVWECAGLPIAIMSFAWRMREVDDECEWRNWKNLKLGMGTSNLKYSVY